MRIVELTDNYLPGIGGTERHVARLAAALVERGHDLTVVTLARPGVPNYEVDAAGVRVIRVDGAELGLIRRAYRSGDSFHPPLPLPGTARKLGRLIANLGPDVVHGHNWLTYPFAAARGDIPLVHTLHDYGGVCPKMTLLRPDGSICDGPSLTRCLPCAATQYRPPVAGALTVGLRIGAAWHRRIDRVLAVSQPVADAQAAAFGGPIEVVPTFIADGLKQQTANAARPSFVPDGPYLLFVGALTTHKGVQVAVDAHQLLRRRLGDTCPPLVLIGVRKPDTPVLDAPGVHIVENVAHDQVMAAWTHASVGLVPSLWAEPWGQVVAEALTARCPLVVSSTVGLAPQVTDANAGLVVPAGDVAGFTDAIARLLGDPDTAHRLSVNGARLAETLTVSSVVGRLEAIFAEVAAGRGR